MNKQLQQHAAARIRSAETPASQLRQVLEQLEILFGKIKLSSPEEIKNLPHLFDQAADLLDTLDASGAQLPSEYARFDTVCAEYRNKAVLFIKLLGGRKAFENLRDSVSPPKERWWWYIDAYIDEQGKQRQKKTIRTFITTIAVFGLLVAIYLIFLAPDEATRQLLNYQSEAEQAIIESKPEIALQALDNALTISPEDDRSLILYGIAAQLSGSSDLAEESFAKAKTVIGSELDFYAQRSQLYLSLGQAELALEDAEKALTINPESAFAHYQKGLAANAMGDIQTAFLALEAAASFANQEGKIELEGMARIQMAYISSTLGVSQPTETPTE